MLLGIAYRMKKTRFRFVPPALVVFLMLLIGFPGKAAMHGS